jgi:cyclopropane fatty-acyl-phospholipid synthase-like methyltransferase
MFDNDVTSPDLAPAFALRRLIFGHRVTEMIAVATRLGLADQLGDTAQTALELASRLALDSRSLQRLLRALVSVGVVVPREHDRFALTPMGHCLRSDVPDSQRAWVLLESADFFQDAWAALGTAVQTGRSAADHALGMPFYQYMATNAEAGENFQQAMAEASQLAADAVVAAYPIAPGARVVDVGGGYGTLLTAILQAHPTVRGVLFDRPDVVALAGAQIERAGVLDRCELFGGDFFTAVPAGGDIYILSRVLMDHDDARSRQLLQNCYDTMTANSRLLIIQQVLPDDTADARLYDGAMSDLNMLIFLPGCERTLAQYRALLSAAGLAITSVVPTRALMSIIECSRIDSNRAVADR